MSNASETRAYRLMAAILRPLLFASTRRDWRGAEHLPEGAFIAAGNHMTNVDPLTMTHFLYDNGRPPKILAKSSLWKVPVVGRVLTATGMIPVHRGTATAGRALEGAEAALAAGECVEMFPEGTLTGDPGLWPMVAKTGVARLALATRAPVVPIAHWGEQRLLPQRAKMLRGIPRKPITVVAGPPVDLSDLYDRPADAVTLREATDRIMGRITAQLAEIRGEEPPAEPFDRRKKTVDGR